MTFQDPVSDLIVTNIDAFRGTIHQCCSEIKMAIDFIVTIKLMNCHVRRGFNF